MARGPKPIPDGCHSIIPHLVVKEASKAIDFYKQAFGALEMSRMCGPGGQIMHAAVKIGGGQVFLSDEFPQSGIKSPVSLGATTFALHLFVADVDAAFAKAIAAGATVTMPVADMFWGDRYGKLRDPFGHEWSLATHIEDVPPEEMQARAQAMFSGQGPC